MDCYLKRLRDANERRHQEWANGNDVDLSFRGVELAGEVGEVCNEIKKLERVRLSLAGGKTEIESIKEELADVMICADLIAMDLGIDLGPEIEKKFNQTSRKVGLQTMFDGNVGDVLPTEQEPVEIPASLNYEPLDLDEIQSEADRVENRPKSSGGWREQPATSKQLTFLRKLGYTGSEDITKSEASDLIPIYKEKRGYE